MRARPRNSLSSEERKVRSRLTKLVHDVAMTRGSIIAMSRSCGQASCHCQKGKKHVSPYLGISKSGKVRMIFLAKDWQERVKQWVKNYDEVKDLLEKLSDMYRKRLIERKD